MNSEPRATENWYPIASREVIEQRARMLQQIRTFMSELGVLEVETPVLSHATVTDPCIESFKTDFHPPDSMEETVLYLQTSPEYAMKRLLASGLGAIYQIARVFRDREAGRLHNPEFTLLEWYRPGYGQHAMMDEVECLIIRLGFKQCDRISYAEIFERHTGLNPHVVSTTELLHKSIQFGLNAGEYDLSFLLNFIFDQQIAPHLAENQPIFIYDYPASLCALAKLRQDSLPVAERFELYINGIEIANGFNELDNVEEQRQRFQQNNMSRIRENKVNHLIDERFLAALEHGLPACSGVALGIDRLLMLLAGCDNIEQVLTFPINRA